MKEKITPCFWYNNQAKEAAALYCSVFAQAKITAQSPMVTGIDVSGQSITLLDGGPMYKPNPSISFFYVCEKGEEFDRIWNAFTKDGTVLMPAGKYPWSEKYGWVTDTCGLSGHGRVGTLSVGGAKVSPCRLCTGKLYGRRCKRPVG